jgi:hypothetical protein
MSADTARHRATMLILVAILTSPSHAQNAFEALGQKLRVISVGCSRCARLALMSDVTVFVPERPPPGLLLSNAVPFVAPRAALLFDTALGPRLTAHVQARIDRGYDPGRHPGGDARFDEYFVEATFDDTLPLSVRAGKFATVFGSWVERHLAWDNPLITAPALYEDMVAITDRAAPADLASFLARGDLPDNKAGWVPLVWGPSYTTGAALATNIAAFELAVEVKNAALSSRPAAWSAVDRGFETAPTVTGRVAWQPRADWTFGMSGSRGPYLRREARASLPPGRDLDDFLQTLLAVDLTYERHRLQVWLELVRGGFEVPRVGDVDTFSGFVEVRYKFAPQWWFAGRWNQSWYDDTPGLDRAWDRALRRLDLGLGYRHDAHVEIKLEYSRGDQSGGDTNGNHLFATQLVIWF